MDSCVWQSGGGGQSWPAAQAEPQPEALVTLHVQPFTQSVSLVQVLSAKAERALSRDEMLEHYATVSGRSVDEIDYYVILARFKLAIVLEAGYARVVNGTADNPGMAAYEHGVLDNMRAAAELASTTKLGQ